MSTHDHTPSDPTPKYGFRSCLGCGTPIPIKIRRDVDRKKYCSRSCQARHIMQTILLPNGLFVGSAMPDEQKILLRAKQSATLKETWQSRPHPFIGRRHSEESKRKVAESQKRRAQERPESYRRGPNHPQWNGGRFKSRSYIEILMPEHPRANCLGYVREHVVIAERSIGRPLEPDEVVHHKNGIKDDNRPENLEVMKRSEHTRMHAQERWLNYAARDQGS